MSSSDSNGGREGISRRFSLLPDACQEALLVAAAIGTEFRVETVSAVCKRRIEQVREALDGDSCAQFVTPVSDASGAYRFSDAAVRAVLYEEIPAARRPWLHREIGESLERAGTQRPAR
jgi:predicted ATPase